MAIERWRGIASAAALLLLGMIPVHAAAQTAPPASPMAAAQQAMAAQDWPTAVKLLREAVAAAPENGNAWNLLGTALRRSGSWQEAVEAHGSAAKQERTRPLALYGTGMAWAQGGQLDSAFAYLQRAKETKRVYVGNVAQDPLAATLQQDARYAQLFPAREEYAAPFVEPTRIVHDWSGEAAGDQFGWIARSIGDADGDGVADVVTSAPTHGSGAGKVYVYSGRSGRMLWSANGPAASQFGTGLEGAGDVNGDGRGDVIAGAPGAGRAFVYSGLDGSVLLTLEGEVTGSLFGRSVAGAGDTDGDGNGDVLVGAPGHGGKGRVYLFSGRDGRVLWQRDGDAAGDQLGSAVAGNTIGGTSWRVIGAARGGERRTGRVYVYRGATSTPAFVIDGDSAAAAVGAMFVSVIGDVNADGTPDVYASDWASNDRGPSTGRIYIHSGADGARLHTLVGEAAGDGFGIGPADAGDVDGDGHADMIIGAWMHASAAPAGGKVYLYSGKSGQLVRAWTSRVAGETFGFDATGVGDVDGDGAIDFLLTSAWSSITGPRAGRMLIISGR